MIHNFTSGPERTVSLLATAMLHIILIAWFLMSHAGPVVQPTSVSTFVLPGVAIPRLDTGQPAPLSPPPMPSPQKQPKADPVSMTTGNVSGKVSSAALAEACSPLEAVTKAIADDAKAVSALNMVPRSERSISEVIVIWNAGWSPAVGNEGALLTPLRTNILHALSVFPSECLAQLVAGPRLVPISTELGTSFLAIGSGSWSWSQLFEPAIQSPTIVLPVLTGEYSLHRISNPA